jgi:hypothetical protein
LYYIGLVITKLVYLSVFPIDFLFLFLIFFMTFACIGLHIIKKYVHRPLHGKISIGRGHSEFREELMDSLRMPYSQREYEKLLQDFTIHKQIQRHRELRGGIKAYDTGVLGKSYSEHYPGK